MSTDPYLFVTCPDAAAEPDLARLRGFAIADAAARFRRARGEEVAFGLAVAGGAEGAAGAWPRALERLGISVDAQRLLATGSDEHLAATRALFDRLVDAGLAYRRGDGWYLRCDALYAECDRRLDELDGWSDAARAGQRRLLRRVDGFELHGQALDGTPLSLFTGHPDAIATAEFVGVSALLPEVDGWLEDGEVRARVESLRGRDWTGKAAAELPVVDVGMSAQVPGIAQPLPILVSPAVDVRFGAAAILGIPEADADDRAMAKGLPKLGGLAWKVDAKGGADAEPAVRFLAPDMPLARAVAGDGDPVAIHPRLATAWAELALALAPGARAGAALDDPALGRLLPTALTVAAPDDGAAALLDARVLAKALREAGVLSEPADGEPHGRTIVHGSLRLDGAAPLDGLIDAHGADAVRFALLHAAAPEKPFAARSDSLVRQSAAFLARVRELAADRLAAAPAGSPAANGSSPATAAIDAGDGLRRRLARWCDTAIARTGENHERLDTHRATRNAIELLARIEDFERRVVEHRGELAGPDREASAAAVTILVELLAPLAPALAADLGASRAAA